MKRIVYLDYNIIQDLMKKTNIHLNSTIRKLHSKCTFPYSPAHIEEIATPMMHGKTTIETTNARLAYIKELSKKNEIFPSPHITIKGKMSMIKESPSECYKRVTDQYERNPKLEEDERKLLEEYKARDPDGAIAIEVSNYGDSVLSRPEFDQSLREKVISDYGMIHFLGRRLSNTDFDHLKENLLTYDHEIVERVIELTLNHLEFIRYKPESIKKHRSRMHDSTHAIYATYADNFVTSDERFMHKLRAVYHYFSIKVNVYHQDEFIRIYNK